MGHVPISLSRGATYLLMARAKGFWYVTLHHVHLEHLLIGLAHPALDGGQPKPLMGLKSVTAAEPIVHTINQQHVNLQSQAQEVSSLLMGTASPCT